MNEKQVGELIQFSTDHKWEPQHPSSSVRRFLTELISSSDMIFELKDEKGYIAAAVLLDKVNNLANDACLEIIGLRADADASTVFAQMIQFAKDKTPSNRSGFQVSFSDQSVVSIDQLENQGLAHYYNAYEMRRSNLISLVQNKRSEIIKATVDDKDRAYKILGETFAQNPETSIPDIETFRKRFLKSQRAHFYLWLLNDVVLGFASLIEGDNGQETEIRNIGVLPSARGQGIGQHLLSHCLQESFALGYQTCQLTVAAANQKALDLYLRSGFEIVQKQQCFRLSL
jgi:ribosomal protein S18 acetylase RimI-like enzyme